MARISVNENFTNESFGDSLQLPYWVLDSGATCHMMLEVSDFITYQLDDMDKNIEVVDGHQATPKQKGHV